VAGLAGAGHPGLTQRLLPHSRDLFVEVSHGPYLVEHNVFGSPASLELFSQGGAFVNNLICGTLRLEPVPDRATPYHRPHSTQLAGYAVIFGGDDRYVGNLFVGGDPSTAYGPAAEGYGPTFGGTAGYDGHPASFGEYLARIDDQPPGDHHRFLAVKQPVYARANAYAAGARPFDGELEPRVLGAATATVVDEGDMVYLITELPDAFDRARIGVVTGRDLERVRCADADFEEADGGPAIMEIDLIGEVRQPGGQAAVGPIAALMSGAGRTRIF